MRNLGTPLPRIVQALGRTAAGLLLLGVLAACTTHGSLLPQAVYFLGGSDEEAQVWRLDADGVAAHPLTDVDGGVETFAVSPADGSLAFVGGNRLFLQDGETGRRRVVVHGDQAADGMEGDPVRDLVGAPVFSSNGRTLAYSLNGLHLLDLPTGQDVRVLANLGNLLGETFVFAKEDYAPSAWSPDNRQLLISMGYFEGSTLAIMEAVAEPSFVRLRSDGPVCCMYVWTPDSRAVLVANPSVGTHIPGLWRYDAETGAAETILPGIAHDGSTNYVGWPHQLPSGDLLFFHASLERFSPDLGIPMMMVRRAPDGSDPTPLRPETFQIVEALWAPDGSLALVSQPSTGSNRNIVLVPTDGSPLQLLLAGDVVRELQWGP